MRGKSKYKKKVIEPDEKFGSTTVAKFINYIMQRGKKTVAKRIVYDSLEIASKQSRKEPLDIFNQALSAVSPAVEVRGRRIGGANYQIPIEVKEPRRTALAMRWMITAAKSRGGRNMSEKLAAEYLEAIAGTGAAMKKKIDTHKMAEANRAFAHFARIR